MVQWSLQLVYEAEQTSQEHNDFVKGKFPLPLSEWGNNTHQGHIIFDEFWQLTILLFEPVNFALQPGVLLY